MIIQQETLDNLTDNKQKVFLKGNTFLLLFVGIMYLFRLITDSLKIVLCPLKLAANIPCPFCGGTRCAMSFFSLDFKASFMYHPATMILMVYAIIAEIVYITDIILKKDNFQKIYKFNTVLIVYLTLVVIQYFIRLIWFFNNIECPFMYTNI